MYRQLLRQSGFKPKKRLGQHFLIDEAVLEHILSAAGLSPGDAVIEVGPGLGILTEALARKGARVIAVEVDRKLVALLKKRLAAFSNVRIVHADILAVEPGQVLRDNLSVGELSGGYKVIANLPYYIASPVLSHFLETEPRPAKMVIMVQKEVGETIAAARGKMRLLSVKAQFYGKTTIVSYVPASSFYPPPKVDSVILRLDLYPQPPVDVSDVAGFFDIVMHGFGSPRKQLRNSLAHSLEMPPGQAASLLEKAGIEARRRAETLSLQEWRELWKVFVAVVHHSELHSGSRPDCCHGKTSTRRHGEPSERSEGS